MTDERFAFLVGLAQPWVDGPIEAAELYRVADLAGPTVHWWTPRVVGYWVALLALISGVLRVLRIVRRKPQDVVLAVTASHVVLLRVTAGLRHPWRVDQRIGSWLRESLRVTADGDYGELSVHTPGRRYDLVPLSYTPCSQQVAALLSGG